MASQIEDFFTSLTGMPLMGGTEPIPVAPTVATAPVSAGPAPQLADVVGTPPAQPSSVFGDERTREKLQAIFAALSQNPNGRSPVEHLGTALTTGYKVGEARKQQTKDEQRKAVEEGQKDAQTKLGLEKGQYELDKAKKVDPIALKTAELAYQTATTDGERKRLEYELFQMYGAKEYEAKIAKLRAEADSARTTAAKGANDLKGETAPWGTEEHMGAMRRNASVVKSFTTTEMVQDPTTGLSTPVATFNEAAFQDWYQKNQGAYPKAADVKSGKAKAGRTTPPASAAPKEDRTTAAYWQGKYPTATAKQWQYAANAEKAKLAKK